MSEQHPNAEIEVEPDPLDDVFGLVDLEKEAEGAWFKHAQEPDEDPEEGADAPEIELKPDEIEGYRDALVDKNGNGLRAVRVTSRSTKAYQDAFRRVQRMAATKKKGKKREAFARIAANQLTADHCVLEWDFTTQQGKQIPCDQQMRRRVLSKEHLRNHAAFIYECIVKFEQQIAAVIEEDRGN